jgi:hypothetical protein
MTDADMGRFPCEANLAMQNFGEHACATTISEQIAHGSPIDLSNTALFPRTSDGVLPTNATRT